MAKEKPPVFVESQPVKDKPTVSLDPAKAYVMVRASGQVPLYLMRVPTPDEQATYDRLRADALAEARGKYARKLKTWEAGVRAAKDNPRLPTTDRPVEPTEANFQFPAFGQMAAASIGPLNRFAKGEGGASTYLQEITPGSYRIYGLIAAGQNGAMVGSCFCLGSIAFDAPAGAVTDLGAIGSGMLPSTDPVEAAARPLFVPAPPGSIADSRIAALPLRPARFRPVGKMPNFFGLPIGRVPAMPGVMRYERDRIIDLTGEAPAPSSAAVTAAK